MKYLPGIGSSSSEVCLKKNTIVKEKNDGLKSRAPMKLKSFFVNTIEEAIRLARHEWGPNAMLVKSKRSGVEARHLGFYEPEPGPNEHRPVGSRAAASPLPVDKLSQDFSELEQRLEKLALTWARFGCGMASVALAAAKFDVVAA
jgi:hypothetical protein